MGKYTCQRPIHPGELLKEEIESRGLPQTRLAAQTGISYKILNDCGCSLTTTCSRLPVIRLSWSGLPKCGSSRPCCDACFPACRSTKETDV